MQAFVAAALCLFQVTYAERNLHDLLSPFTGDVHSAVTPASTSATKTTRNASSRTSTKADDEDADDRKGLGQPCAIDGDCLAGRGLSCQEWVCACAPNSPVKVQVQGIDTCLPAKALYEACRYHEECSHRSVNMRCIDFLCYCPLPFELRGNGDCLAPKPDLGKWIAAVTPTTLLIIVMASIGGAFIFRRLFPSDDKKNSTAGATRRQDQRPMSSSFSPRTKVPSNSISVRHGPLKSLRPKKPNLSLQNNSTSAPTPSFPSTRLLRVPPDQLRPDAFSPGPTSTTTAMRTSSFSPPVPFAGSSQMLDKSSARSTALPQPSRLSTLLLMNKLLSSSADSSDEDNIFVGVLGYNPASQSKSPKQPQRTSLPFTAINSQRREGLPFRTGDGCAVDDGSSLPIEWGTSTSNWDRRSSLAAAGKQVATKEGLKNGCDDDPSGRTLFSSFRQSKNVTFLDKVSPVSVAGRSQLNEENTPGQVAAKPSTTFAEHERGMKVGSLKAETRWLCQNAPAADTEANAASSGRRLSEKSEPARTEPTEDIAGVTKDEADTRAGDTGAQSLSRGARNRLGLGTPFVGPEEGYLAESASIPLSFLSSSSPSFEVLPKPDISSGLLRDADALLQSAAENADAADSQEQQDASLVAEFMAAVLRGDSPSDGAAAPLSHPLGAATAVERDAEGAPVGAAAVEAALRVVPSAETMAVQSPRLSSASAGLEVLSVLVEEAPRGDTPEGAAEITAPAAASGAGRCDSAATEPPTDVTSYDEKAGQSVESTPSSTDIENLAEILNRLKVTQLGNEHHRRERTLQRDYGFVAPALSGLSMGPRWPKAAANTVAPFTAVELGAGLGAARPSVETAVAPAKAMPSPSPPCAPTVAVPSPRSTPTLPPLMESREHSTELPPSGEGSYACLSSDFRMPADIQSESSRDDEAERDDAVSCATRSSSASEPRVQRRRPSPAQLHRARTASSRLVAPAAPSSRRPVPLKRSIRFRRTTASQLEVIAEVFHGAQMLSPTPLARKTPVQGEGERLGGASPEEAVAVSPLALDGNIAQPLEGGSPPEPKTRASRGSANSRVSREDTVVATTLDSAADAQDASKPTQPRVRAVNVRSEPLRARSPFAMRKHFSEPFNAKEIAAVLDKTGHRDDEWSLSSPFSSSEFDSFNTPSSSAAGGAATEGGIYDTDALMPSSIPTVTATSEQGEEAWCNGPTLPSSLCESHSHPRIPTYVLLPPADSSLYAAGSTTETDVHLSTITADSTPQPEILDEAAGVATPPPVLPRVRQRTEAVKSPPPPVTVEYSAAPKERKTRKSRADLQANGAAPSRPIPLPRRIKDILSSNVSSVWRTSRDNTAVTVCATFAETLTVGTSPTPRISPSTLFPVSSTVTMSSCKVHASATYGSRGRDTPTSHDRNDRATGAATICTMSAVVEAPSSKRESKPARRKEKKATRKNSSLPRFFFGRHRDSDGGDDASSVRSESSGTTDGLRLSLIMAKLGILPSSHRFFSSTTTTDTGGSSLETVLPSRHGAGDRGGHFGNADGASPQRAVFGAESGGAPSSRQLPRVWPEPSTSFSVVETSDAESVVAVDSRADALPFEREVLRRDRRGEQRRRSASPPRSAAYVSPDPEWFSCSSRISDRQPPSRSRRRKTSE
ncbi:serine-rich adhesin for platelets-like [Dermacentor albipictus]|uniref:serine-rich adhesin for platelets-like n=1 Tax=Dermacentor albipictus TaxID=60249 RepID=UPI0031FCCD2D